MHAEDDAKVNVDPKDIARFNKQSKDWWDLNGYSHMMHDMNHMRVPWVLEGLKATKVLPQEATSLDTCLILDVGCGGGIFTEGLAKLGARVIGLDCAHDLLEVARHHLSTQETIKSRVTYVCETIEEHCKANANKYDAIVCSEVIEHIVDKDSFLAACARTLKPGGSIFMTTLSRTFTAWFFAKLWAEYILGMIERGTHDWRLFIDHGDLSAILARHGVETVSVRGTSYDFYRRNRQKRWHFGSLKAICYALQAVKCEKSARCETNSRE